MKNFDRPTLVVFKGMPGTGKSTLARALHEQTGWTLFVRDEIKEQLIANGAKEVGMKSHRIMWDEAERALRVEDYFICDTNLNQRVVLDDLREFKTKTRSEILIIECIAEENIIKSRLERRKDKGLMSFWIDSWEKYQHYKESEKNQGDFELPYPRLEVNTGKKVVLDEVIRWVEGFSPKKENL